jgi:hypothetical protein
MSWLRRVFGGGGAEDGEDERSAVERILGPSGSRHTGYGERPLPEARAELLDALRARGARSAIVAYDGGNDEGGVTGITASPEPLPNDPLRFADETLATGESFDVDAFYEGNVGPQDQRLFEAAEAVVCDKWGSFAGEFEVRGRLVVDVDSGRIARHDAMRTTEDDPYDEDSDDEYEAPDEAFEREVEEV